MTHRLPMFNKIIGIGLSIEASFSVEELQPDEKITTNKNGYINFLLILLLFP